MTSNIGVRQLKDFGMGVGFATSSRVESESDNNKSVIQNALKKTFSPEFLNRIDDVVIFNSLEKEHIFSIIDITLNDLMKRLNAMEFKLTLTDEVKNFVADKGFDPNFGARPLNRAIQKYIEDPLAEFILGENPESGSILKADLDKENEKIIIRFAEKTESKAE